MFNTNSLLLYKGRPARLLMAGDRLEIELDGGETARVRPKDVEVLHPGPLRTLADLRPVPGDIHTAWEILAGERTSLPELAELAFGAFTPASAWAAYQAVAEGVYFETDSGAIRARTLEEVAKRKLERDLHEAGQRAWKSFLDRAKHGAFDPADRDFLRDTENLALGRSERSQVLRELGRSETRENAHTLLLELGVWEATFNPYPLLLGVPLDQPDLPIPPLPDEERQVAERRDLTHLQTFAIDDEGTDTPDDALSLEGERVWVHIADVAALVEPGSPLDQEARSRGLSLHLPEGTVHLFPRPLTEILGLGLQEVSPALSFGFDLAKDGEVRGMEIVPAWVRVTRLTYAAAEILMESEPFATLEKKLSAARERRRANGAVMIDFPEVRVDVENGQVTLRPLPPLRSRALVEESMILTGAETARFASEQRLPVPYSQQEPLETAERPTTLSGMFALRRLLKRSRQTSTPGPHGGLGVPAYTQATSPLRRYLDLLVHQQLRAFLAGRPVMDEAAIVEALGAVEAVTGDNRQAEFLSEKHWTLVFLLQNPGWRGEGILVDKRGASGTVMIPSLALETRVHLKHDLPLDSLVTLALTGVNLPQREASFRIER